MKKITLLILFISLFVLNSNAQEFMRSTLGVSGSSTTITSNYKSYVIQQSVGQTSVIGNFKSNGIMARQGFIQPPLYSSKVIPEETNLEAIIYPNPLNNQLNISFKEPIKAPVFIRVFDLLGRSVFVKQVKATQQLSIDLSFLASAQYLFIAKTGHKQFKANLIKQ